MAAYRRCVCVYVCVYMCAYFPFVASFESDLSCRCVWLVLPDLGALIGPILCHGSRCVRNDIMVTIAHAEAMPALPPLGAGPKQKKQKGKIKSQENT